MSNPTNKLIFSVMGRRYTRKYKNQPIVSYEACLWKKAPCGVMFFQSPDWDRAVSQASQLSTEPKCLNCVQLVALDFQSALFDAENMEKPKRAYTKPSVTLRSGMQEKLRDLSNMGKLVVFFSNQAELDPRENEKLIAPFCAQVEALWRLLGIPIAFLGATKYDEFRTPSVGLRNVLEEHLESRSPPVRIDISESFFVGNRLGRAQDTSAADFMFSLNAGLRVMSTESFISGKTEYIMQASDLFNPHVYLTAGNYTIGKPPSLSELLQPAALIEKLMESPCLVVMQGGTCSGRTTFAQRYLPDHELIEQPSAFKNNVSRLDVYEIIAATLDNGVSVVVDGFHSSKFSRAALLEIARECHVPSYCLRFTTPQILAQHLSVVREILTGGAERRLPYAAFDVYNIYYEQVSDDEGFNGIGDVLFRPHFQTERHKSVFSMYTEVPFKV